MTVPSDPQQSQSVATAFTELAHTMRQLTADDGCAWHGVQSHHTLVRYLIEETFELVETIETDAPADDLREELADLLYQVMFHAAIAERSDEGFSIVDVAETLNEKLIARHPHVFGDRGFMSVEELNAQWEQLKADAAGRSRGMLEGIPKSMPALARAEKIIDRLERAGMIDDVAASALTREEVGSKLVHLIRQAHMNNINVDEALRVALRALTENIGE